MEERRVGMRGVGRRRVGRRRWMELWTLLSCMQWWRGAGRGGWRGCPLPPHPPLPGCIVAGGGHSHASVMMSDLPTERLDWMSVMGGWQVVGHPARMREDGRVRKWREREDKRGKRKVDISLLTPLVGMGAILQLQCIICPSPPHVWEV